MKLITGIRSFASGFFTTVLFLSFLLVFGDIFLHRLVEILPRFGSKRPVVDISQQNRKRHFGVSGHDHDHECGGWYRRALVMWLTGMDSIFWGTVAFLLNFVPIPGPAGMLTDDPLWQALAATTWPHGRRRSSASPSAVTC